MKLKRLFIFVVIIILLGLLAYYYPYIQSTVSGKAISSNSQDYQKEPAFVTRVVDGDTIEVRLENNLQKVRLLGINTPEKNKPEYQEAKDFLIKEIENKTVELLRDTTDIDKYNRKLRYVFYKDSMINVELVQQGFATTFMLDELKYKDKFINAEKFAKNNNIGMWKKSQNICADCISLLNLSAEGEFFIIKNICNHDCNLAGWLVKDDANHFFQLNNLNAEESKTYNSKIEIWNDGGDRFFMRDAQGNLVVFYEY